MATGTQIEVVMPQMGVSVSEGTVTKWLKQPGDTIARDEALLEISTDKVDTEIPSPGDGVVGELLVAEGDTVEVGTLLATILPVGAVAMEAPAGSGARPPPCRASPSLLRPSRPSPRHREQAVPAPVAADAGVGERPHVRLAGRRAHRRRARRRPEHRRRHGHGRPRDEEGHPGPHRVGRCGPGRLRLRAASGPAPAAPAPAAPAPVAAAACCPAATPHLPPPRCRQARSRSR